MKVRLRELTHEELDILVKILSRNKVFIKNNNIMANLPKRVIGGVIYSIDFYINKKMMVSEKNATRTTRQ